MNIRPKNSTETAERPLTIEPGRSVYVPSINRTIKVLSFAPYGMRNPATGEVQFYHTDNDEYINPTVELEVYEQQPNRSTKPMS